MFEVPGFDPRSMTDDQLIERQAVISRRLAFLASYGGAVEAVGQLQNMSTAIDVVRRERMFMLVEQPDKATSHIAVETDPILATKETEPNDPAAKVKARRRPMADRMPAPVKLRVPVQVDSELKPLDEKS